MRKKRCKLACINEEKRSVRHRTRACDSRERILVQRQDDFGDHAHLVKVVHVRLRDDLVVAVVDEQQILCVRKNHGNEGGKARPGREARTWG